MFFKVVEHSFRARFCWYNSARAQGFQNTNVPSIEWSFYLTPALYVVFPSIIERSVLMVLVFCYKDILEKVTMQRNQQIVIERTQLNAAHAQLLEKLRPIAWAETCRF